MLDVVQKPLRRFRQRYDKSGLKQFLSWWYAELVGMLPTGLRALLSSDRAHLAITPLDTGWRVDRVRGGRVEESQGAETQEGLTQALTALTPEGETPLQVLVLPQSSVLRRRVNLPAAAEEHLEKVLGFEMDRQTPFRADQLYVDSYIAKRDATARTLLVDMLAIPRAALDQRLAALGNIALDGVDVAGPEGLAGFNILPGERRARRTNQRLRINVILAISAVALLWLVMWQSLQLRESAISNLAETMDESRLQATQTTELKRQLRDAIEGANFLAKKKSEQPISVDVLNEITQLVPDDTWLERVSFTQTDKAMQVQLQGQSARADKLIGLLTKSKCLTNPQFIGIIQPDGATGKERFTLSADLRTGVCHGADAVAATR